MSYDRVTFGRQVESAGDCTSSASDLPGLARPGYAAWAGEDLAGLGEELGLDK